MDTASNPYARTNIVMVGLMGAGKSSVGRRLAAKLGLAFVDADSEIEAAAGETISEIFARHGEARFRDRERGVIGRILDRGGQVLATGGGAFMDGDTRALIAERAISVWLRAELEILLERVLRRNNRPLLKTGDPRQVLQKLMEERYPVYAEADITIDSHNAPHKQTVAAIVAALDGHRARR